MKNFSDPKGKQESLSSLRLASGNSWLATLVLMPILFVGAFAQQAVEGIDNGNYHYQGSFEFGYRFVDTHGSQAIYDTFVNQRQGPRLLDETLNVRSLNHEGGPFDTLFLSSFGWSGDPENASRLRMSKNRWYDFSGTFRRDHNYFDYNALANPLNPANAYVQVNDSPHAFATVRRMYDYNLTLAPQSPVRVRLGFTRNNMEGPAFSSVHQGTDAILLQNTRTLLDGYQLGVDFKVFPRPASATISFCSTTRATAVGLTRTSSSKLEAPRWTWASVTTLWPTSPVLRRCWMGRPRPRR